jgi:hypothetical protein
VVSQTVFPAYDGAKLNDLSARMSAAYDLFGNGKTAVKVSFGKFLVAQDNNGSLIGPGGGATVARLTSSVSRSWTDSNGNRVVDCDLSATPAGQAAQNLSGSGGDVCGAGNLGFAQPTTNTVFDPAIYRGWGVRPFNYAFDVSVQHQLLPRVSVNVGYFRRWFGNFLVTQNRNLGPSDYDLFTLPVPSDSRLPNGGGGTVQGQDVIASKFSLPQDNIITAASNFGEQYQHWNGADFTVNARLREILVQGGVSTGRTSTDNCDVISKLRALTQFCHVDEALQTQVKLLGAYTVPRVDVQLAATLQNIPGQEIAATWGVPNATVAPLLPGGRNLSSCPAPTGACTQTTTVNLLGPSTYYSDRVNQLDFRAAKLFRFSGKRMQVALDLFNALNSNVPQTYNNAFSPTGSFHVPTAILPARLARVSAQFDF